MKPEHSVIIIAKDQDNFDSCLSSVRKNTFGSFEIIVVVQNSKISCNEGFWSRFFRKIKYIHCLESFGFAVNRGVDEARGECLSIIHDDVIVSPGWNIRLLGAFEKQQRAACVGPLTCISNSYQELKDYTPFSEITNLKSVSGIQNEISKTYNTKIICAKTDSFCFFTVKDMIEKVVGEFDDLPEHLVLTEWLIRAFKIGRLFPYIDTFTYVHHTDKSSSNVIYDKDSLLKITKKHGSKAFGFVENDLYLKLKKE